MRPADRKETSALNEWQRHEFSTATFRPERKRVGRTHACQTPPRSRPQYFSERKATCKESYFLI